MYRDGSGVSKSDDQAVGCFRRAGLLGDLAGQLNLARAYENGRGVTRNYPAALYWYRKAAAQGSAERKQGLDSSTQTAWE
jgi:uncharacterized protein